MTCMTLAAVLATMICAGGTRDTILEPLPLVGSTPTTAPGNGGTMPPPTIPEGPGGLVPDAPPVTLPSGTEGVPDR